MIGFQRGCLWREYIVADPHVMLGKPVVQGTRITADKTVQLARLIYALRQEAPERANLWSQRSHDKDAEGCITGCPVCDWAQPVTFSRQPR
jgi:hypothetical protein